ncbi:MAG: aldose epimerase family protein [Opitutales bacterium]
MTPSISVQPYGLLRGQHVNLFTLENAGCRAEILDYGGSILRWWVPDRDGNLGDIIVGPERLDALDGEGSGFGALVGRCANRIGGSRFELDGVVYDQLPDNDEDRGNCLHGGRFFQQNIWRSHALMEGRVPALHLTYVSPDGEGGFPGEVVAHVVYRLQEIPGEKGCVLEIHYTARTTRLTPVNLTNHAYFNLAAVGRDILGHELQVNADSFTPVDEHLLPTGELAPVDGTPFDFTTAKPVGRDINRDHRQLQIAGGYDHNFVLRQSGSADGLRHAATLREPGCGRVLEVHTTEPGIQVYSGAHINNPGFDLPEKRGAFAQNPSLCLETQHFPDAPNQPNFPSVFLAPEDTFESVTQYRSRAE